MDAGPFFLRLRTPVLEGEETGSHDHVLQIVWPYADEGSGAMPTGADSDRMKVFEDRLCAAWESDGLAVLTAVLTYNGARQWVFYTHTVPECGKRLSEMDQEEEPYPIELTSGKDSGWDFLHDQILQNLNWKEYQQEWKQSLEGKKASE